MLAMEQMKRERAAWRFDPRVLERLRKFVAAQDRQITQTAVIEAAIDAYIERNEKRSARR